MSMNSELLTRRQAVARIALLMGGAMIGGDAILRGETRSRDANAAGVTFGASDIALLDEIGETIIPTTQTPGAKAAGVGAFVAMMVNDCYSGSLQLAFHAGLGKVSKLSRERFGTDFASASAAQRTALLNDLDREQREHEACREEGEAPHYFRMMKQLTLLGYFTSEIGATQALRYVEVPGGYDGNAPYKKGDRAWFSNPSKRL
jgi:hypothetical protein